MVGELATNCSCLGEPWSAIAFATMGIMLIEIRILRFIVAGKSRVVFRYQDQALVQCEVPNQAEAEHAASIIKS